MITLGRGRWDGSALTDVHDIFSAIQNANASRIIFGKDGMIYMSVGIGDPPGAARAQDPNDLAGKVLRLRDDGTRVPAITPSGLTFYTGNKFPNWKNNVFVGGLRRGEVPRSG